jgi:outer membrane protein assembly factor BamB
VETAGSVEGSPALSDDGTLYFGSVFGVFYAVDSETGEVKWTNEEAGGGYFSSPALGTDGAVIAGNDDGVLYAFDPETGEIRWRFTTGEQGEEPGAIASSPAVGGDGTIYFGCDNGSVYAVGPDGKLRSRFAVEATEVPGATVAVISSPTLGPDGTLYIGANDGYLYAFNDRTEPLPGDLNQDGRVLIGDAMLALRYVVGAVRLTPAQLKAADVYPGRRKDGSHGDGTVGITDVIRILRFTVGLEPVFP